MNMNGGGYFEVKKSKIHNNGLFSLKRFRKGEDLFLALDRNMSCPITKNAKYVNHCGNASSELKQIDDKRWMLVATKDIEIGDEITANYNNTPDFIAKPDPSWKC